MKLQMKFRDSASFHGFRFKSAIPRIPRVFRDRGKSLALCFVDRGVLLGGGESVILWNKFFCCFANSQLLVVCMHVCEHTTSHHFNVNIALNISGLGALHAARDAL